MPQPLPTAGKELATRLLAGRCSRASLLPIALLLTVIGWSALWAQGLGLIYLFPLWTYAAMLFGGLALIPAAALPKPAASPEPQPLERRTPHPLRSVTLTDA